MVEVSNQRMMIIKSFSVPKCERLARMSRKMLGAVPGNRDEVLREIWGRELMSLEKDNTSDFEKQNAIGQTINNTQAVEQNDVTHSKKMECELLLEASGERNLRSINQTHGDYPCHCLA